VPVLVIGNQMTPASEQYMASAPGVYRAPKGLSGVKLKAVFSRFLKEAVRAPVRSRVGTRPGPARRKAHF
jgi:hypothetical protein